MAVKSQKSQKKCVFLAKNLVIQFIYCTFAAENETIHLQSSVYKRKQPAKVQIKFGISKFFKQKIYMAKESKTEFERWINSIPIGDYQMIRSRIMQKTKVSRATFAAWKSGRMSPDLTNQCYISIVASEYDGSRPFAGLEFNEKEGCIKYDPKVVK